MSDAAIQRLLDQHGFIRGADMAAILDLCQAAVKRLPLLDLKYTLQTARAIVDLDLQPRITIATIAEALQYTKHGAPIQIAAMTPSEPLRERIRAVQAQMIVNGAPGATSARESGMLWCQLCGVGMMSENVDAHWFKCGAVILARWTMREALIRRDEIQMNIEGDSAMPMSDAPCGCKFKVFGNDPLALSVKPGCAEGRASLLPRDMARHLGLLKGLVPDPPLPVSGPVSTARRSRAWTPR